MKSPKQIEAGPTLTAHMPDCQPFHDGETSGFLHVPQGSASGSLVLAHGAGSDCRAPLLVMVAEAFAVAGYYVLRCDLPFRRLRKFGPPHPSQAAMDREGLKAAANALQNVAAVPVCLGGHSYGGRQASMLAAEDPSVAERLLLLSYPLHPPNKPAQLRTQHFPKLQTPALFVQGDADPFGSIVEMQTALGILSVPHSLIVIEAAGHDLKRGKFDLPSQVVAPFDELRAKQSTPGRVRN